MPFLQGSGAISINDIRNLFGGPSSPSLSNYYRGGAYIPASKVVFVRDPSSGYYYFSNSYYYNYGSWSEVDGKGTIHSYAVTYVVWAGAVVINDNTQALSSYTIGGVTYYANTYIGGSAPATYGVYRSWYANANININIATSGAISLSQFYGAEQP